MDTEDEADARMPRAPLGRVRDQPNQFENDLNNDINNFENLVLDENYEYDAELENSRNTNLNLSTVPEEQEVLDVLEPDLIPVPNIDKVSFENLEWDVSEFFPDLPPRRDLGEGTCMTRFDRSFSSRLPHLPGHLLQIHSLMQWTMEVHI